MRLFEAFSILGNMIKMRETREGDLGGLAKDFVAHKVSAAGVSYIVTERSRFRRILWFICVMACFLFMGYMTFKVINEYLRYPKVLIKEDAIFHKLPFPAVTVCSLNPISSHHISETSLKRILKLKSMMQKRFYGTIQQICPQPVLRQTSLQVVVVPREMPMCGESLSY
ncbi:uncharacterized protein CEXT_96531 [Caerostris extrusa]|uniref:Uncharacterized protein n=1 Tax=Caerostris extrusa TaxID=172846 RepID=A0AAV4VQI8_CAEEX|nr:uncharacterized protein CEXT_96531 [Caerostris extrusa]